MCPLRYAVGSRACDGEDFPRKFRRRLDGTLRALDAIVRGSVADGDLRARRRRVVRSLRSLMRQTAKLRTRVGRQCRGQLRDRLRNAALVVAGAGRR